MAASGWVVGLAILNHHLSCDNTAALFFHSDVVLIFAFPHLWFKVCYLHGRTIVPNKVRSDAMDSIHQLPICSRAASINTSTPPPTQKWYPPKHIKFKREPKPGCLPYRSSGPPVTWPTRQNMHVVHRPGIEPGPSTWQAEILTTRLSRTW